MQHSPGLCPVWPHKAEPTLNAIGSTQCIHSRWALRMIPVYESRQRFAWPSCPELDHFLGAQSKFRNDVRDPRPGANGVLRSPHNSAISRPVFHGSSRQAAPHMMFPESPWPRELKRRVLPFEASGATRRTPGLHQRNPHRPSRARS